MAVAMCEASAADWCVEAVVGTTFCPETKAGRTCRNRREHDREYGTDTQEYTNYFQGDKPRQSDVSARLGRGWYVLEFKVRRTPQSRSK